MIWLQNPGFRIRKQDFCVERFLKNRTGVKEYRESNEIYFMDSKIFVASESWIQNPKIQKYELNDFFVMFSGSNFMKNSKMSVVFVFADSEGRIQWILKSKFFFTICLHFLGQILWRI
jgi:hypothetical protein